MQKKSFHKKSLGQHFLNNQEIIENIVNSAPCLESLDIFEIGPGNGALTLPLLEKSKKVTAIEFDKRLESFLKSLVKKHDNFSFIMQDALTFDFENVTSPYAIISNLPYNIGTVLLLNWLKLKNKPSYMLLMFQEEVAKRITAQAGSKHFGRLSIISQLLCDCTYVVNAPKEYFTPPPKVDSGVVLLKPKQNTISMQDLQKVETLSNILFSKRRKMIGTSLKNYNIDFTKINIDPKKRPEELELKDFVTLSSFV